MNQVKTQRIFFLAQEADIFPRTGRYRRKDVVMDACLYFDRSWEELRKQGYRVVNAAVSWVVEGGR